MSTYNGRGYYYPPPSAIHDEASLTFAHHQPVYDRQQPPQGYLNNIYFNPPSSHPPPPTPGQYYTPQSFYASPPPPPPQPSMRPARYDSRPVPQHLLDDPAFSDDPRMNPHFAMDDNEEITPTEFYLADKSYRSIDTSRTSSRREAQAAYGTRYTPPVIPEKLAHGNSSRSGRSASEAPVNTRSPHIPLSQDLHKSPESVHLAYDDPDVEASSGPPQISVSASQMARLNQSSSEISSASSSFVKVAPPSPYDIFVPRSPSSSSSSSSSSPSPRTPGTLSHSLPSEDKRSISSLRKGALVAINPDESSEIHDAPPAYSPLPTPTDTSFVPTAFPGPTAADVIPAPSALAPSISSAAPVAGPSTVPATSGSDITFPTTPQRPPLETTISAPELRSAPVQDAPPRPATTPARAPPSGVAPEPIRMQKSRSRKNSIAAAPKDLDRIDELDETDPLGYAWHHESPYEAIKKAVESGFVPGEGGDLRNGKPKIFTAQPDQELSESDPRKSSHRKPVAVDPNLTTFNIKPGQIFPSIVATSQAQIAHQQAFGYHPSQQYIPQQLSVSQSYMNLHMRPSGPSVPPSMPVAPPQQIQQQRSAPRPPYPAQQNSSSDSSRSGRHEQPRTRPGISPLQAPPPQPSNAPPQANTRPPLQHQASSATLSRSVSAPAPRPQGLSSEPPPRPDINLPPRGAPSTTSSQQSGPPRQPHYLPKRLVMPAPLQPTQTAPSGSSGSSGGSGGSVPRSSHDRERDRENTYLRDGRGNTIPNPGGGLKHSASVPSRAQDIPMSSGRNTLKKHSIKEKGDVGYHEPERPKERGGVHIGGFTIIPSLSHRDGRSGGASAVFESRVVDERQKHGTKGWEKEKAREREREREREKEREREREREKERDRGRKLSKRR